MSDKRPHVLLVTDDAQLRSAVEKLAPRGARLWCVQSQDKSLPDDADQVWVDLDSGPVVASVAAARRVYFYSQWNNPPDALLPGRFVRKPCTRQVLDVLWAGVELQQPLRRKRPQGRPRTSLPGWALALHDLRLRELCARLRRYLPARLGYRDVSLYFHDLDRGLLTLVEATHERSIDLSVRTDAVRDSLMAAVVAQRELLATDDAAGAYERFQINAESHSGRYADQSCLIAPLICGERLLGVLNLSQRRPATRTYSPARLATLTAFLARCLKHARAYDRAMTEARVDVLTGQFNSRWMSETLTKELRRMQRFNQPLSLIMIDLDGLKSVNDRVGHAAGDCVLRHVARRVASALRQCDAAARIGGDEFVVMLPATELQGGRLVARRILNAIRVDPPVFRNAALPITASLGLVQWQPGWEVADLMDAADQAMYTAKRQGRDRIVARSIEAGSAPLPLAAALDESRHG